MASPALSIQLDECQFEEMTIPNATFRSELILIKQTSGEAIIAFDSVQKSPDPELEMVDLITETSCEENEFELIKQFTLNATLYTHEILDDNEPELDLASCIVPSTEWGNPSCPSLTDFIIDGINKPEPKTEKQKNNIMKSLITRAHRALKDIDDVVQCDDFHSCEYDISFDFTTGRGWSITINTGCRHKTGVISSDTACIHAKNNATFTEWNQHHLDNNNRQIYTSYSDNHQTLKMSVLKSNTCCGILARKDVKSLVAD
jgi:hypothetical protein